VVQEGLKELFRDGRVMVPWGHDNKLPHSEKVRQVAEALRVKVTDSMTDKVSCCNVCGSISTCTRCCSNVTGALSAGGGKCSVHTVLISAPATACLVPIDDEHIESRGTIKSLGMCLEICLQRHKWLVSVLFCHDNGIANVSLMQAVRNAIVNHLRNHSILLIIDDVPLQDHSDRGDDDADRQGMISYGGFLTPAATSGDSRWLITSRDNLDAGDGFSICKVHLGSSDNYANVEPMLCAYALEDNESTQLPEDIMVRHQFRCKQHNLRKECFTSGSFAYLDV
jgi:hypothetical protein